MLSIKEVLSVAKTAGASDVHITVGVPPKMRVNGALISMDYDRMMPPDTRSVSLMKKAPAKFELSYSGQTVVME